jgi:hypothetical protein
VLASEVFAVSLVPAYILSSFQQGLPELEPVNDEPRRNSLSRSIRRRFGYLTGKANQIRELWLAMHP